MKKIFFSLLILAAATRLYAQTEPNAGSWKTWFISSGKDYRLPAPASRKEEITQVIEKQKLLDATELQKIQYWNAGAPGYRWQEMMNKIWMTDTSYYGILANTLLNVCLYDATIAAWDTKYAYKQPRPFAADKRVKLLIPDPASPAYPCEHSVAAGVAVTIFSRFYPALADSVNRMAQQLMESRIAAGVAFPADTREGFALGKKIALEELEKTKGYINTAIWDGKLPLEPGRWKGKPMFPLGGTSKPIILESGSQFRPPAPPDFAKDMAELKKFKPNFRSVANAFQFASEDVWGDILNKKIFEYNIHLNAPRAARIYAVHAIGAYDGFISCWDAKYAYWGTRPDQYDTTFHPTLFFTPPFPGYPSGHAMLGSIAAEINAYFFPADQAYFRKRAKDGAESRFQGGIHFRTDNEVALDMGKKVAGVIIEKVKKDGADEGR